MEEDGPTNVCNAINMLGHAVSTTVVSLHEVGLRNGPSPVLSIKGRYWNLVPRRKFDYLCIGECRKGMLLGQKLESEGEK